MPEKRVINLNVRITRGERRALEKLSDELERSISDTVRHMDGWPRPRNPRIRETQQRY